MPMTFCAFLRTATDESEPSSAVGQTLEARDVDRSALQNARYLLIVLACLTAIMIIGTFVGQLITHSLTHSLTQWIAGGIWCYSASLFINSTAMMLIFSRVLFLAFLLQCAGEPTSRLAQYRKYKIGWFRTHVSARVTCVVKMRMLQYVQMYVKILAGNGLKLK